MQIYKRKILLEDYISRQEATWGIPRWNLDPTFTAFSINVFFTQDADDIGIPTDLEFIPNPSVPYIDDPYSPNTRFVGKELDDYFYPGMDVSGYTESRVSSVESYDLTDRFKVNFNIKSENVYDYQNNLHTSVDKIVSDNNRNPITYVEGGNDSETINVNNPTPQLGIFFKTYTGTTRFFFDSINQRNVGVQLTELYYKGQGFNETNSTLSAITKEEYLFGITTTPTVESDVFIDRGRNTIFQNHMQMVEIMSMRDLTNYGNGYYKIRK